MQVDTPVRKYFCPRCRAAYDTDQNFCSTCGANMQRASALLHALESSAGFRPTESVATPAPLPARPRRASDSPDPWIGQLVDGRYRVTEIIGKGGMGVVYKVMHQRMGKVAAMKVLHRDFQNDPEVHLRFQREAEAVSRLTHPNTVQVFDFGMVSGALYLVMEYVRGVDVGTMLRRDGPLPVDRALALFTQILPALAEAHEKGIVHRDLKPENVLVTRSHDGRDFAKVLDFGLAKISGRDEFAAVTDRGRIVGTPYYMSPEQIRGDEVDGRTDIYSFGALMYRALTGHYVFDAVTPVAILTRHLTDDPIPPRQRQPEAEVPPLLDRVVMKCLAKEREDRYESVSELLRVLDEVVEAGRTEAMPAHSSNLELPVSDESSDQRLQRADVDEFERSLRRRQLLFATILPLLFLAVCVYVGYRVLGQPKKPQWREREPNNSLETATLISSGKGVRGYIGKRQSPALPDADVYRLASPADPTGLRLEAKLSPVPNMDLELLVYDLAGRMIMHANEGRVGEGEIITDFALTGPFYIMVAQKVADDGFPVENVSDAYRLEVTVR